MPKKCTQPPISLLWLVTFYLHLPLQLCYYIISTIIILQYCIVQGLMPAIFWECLTGLQKYLMIIPITTKFAKWLFEKKHQRIVQTSSGFDFSLTFKKTTPQPFVDGNLAMKWATTFRGINNWFLVFNFSPKKYRQALYSFGIF